MSRPLNILYTSDVKDMQGVTRERLIELIKAYDGVYDIRGLAECARDSIQVDRSRLHLFTDTERMLAEVEE